MKTKVKRDHKLPWSGRIGRIARQIEQQAGRPAAEKVMRDAGEFDQANPRDKAAKLKQTVEHLEQEVGQDQARAVMVACGRKCAASAARRAREIMAGCSSVAELVAKLNAAHIGGGRLRLNNRKTITGGYDRCYCGQVKQTRAPFANTTYCHCSVGWYRQLFETALGRPVQVEITQSIICGAKSCEFVIHI